MVRANQSEKALAPNSKTILRILLVGSLATTLVVSPWNYDPISVTKMALVSLVAISGLILHLFRFEPQKLIFEFKINIFESLLLVFTSLLVVNLFVNHYALPERLFGLGGRNTGFITLLAFTAISFLVSRHFSSSYAFQLMIVLCIANLVVTGYYLLQRVGVDPILVSDFYSRPSSTLGNPNFVSGFLGMTAIVPALLYFQNRTYTYLALTVVQIPLSIFVIFDSQSIQGIFTLGFSVAVLLIILLFKKNMGLGISGLLLFLLGGTVSLIGLLGSGPLAQFLSTTTLLSRFDYWRTAVSMTLNNPLTGVGLDGYWDFYRLYRDEVTFNRFGESQVSDTPHNVFLDFFASGGFPLGISYTTLVFIVYFRVARDLLSNSDLNYSMLSIFVVFNGYLIQSLISPNQIGIAIWFWIFLGCLWNLTQNKKQLLNAKSSTNTNSRKIGIASASKKLSAIPLIVAIPLVLMPVRADANFLKAARSSDGRNLIAASQEWPTDTKRLILVEEAISPVGFSQLKLETALFGVRINPNSYQLWSAILKNEVSPNPLRVLAKEALRRLEPRFDSISN